MVGTRGAERADGSSDPKDWDAFARLYDEHEAHLYRVARLLLPGQAAQAEDAVAETFLKVHRAWLDDRVDNFFGYARQTLVNHVLGMYRKQQTADRHLFVVGAPDRAERLIDESVADSHAVFAALEHLPARRRTAVVLRFYEDLPYDGIATSMDISVGAAKAHVSAGVAQLRELMAGGAE